MGTPITPKDYAKDFYKLSTSELRVVVDSLGQYQHRNGLLAQNNILSGMAYDKKVLAFLMVIVSRYEQVAERLDKLEMCIMRKIESTTTTK